MSTHPHERGPMMSDGETVGLVICPCGWSKRGYFHDLHVHQDGHRQQRAQEERLGIIEAAPSSVGVKIGRAADMADIACRICHHAESDHTRAHAVKKYGFDTRQACTQCACVEWVAPKEVESVDDVAAVDLIDDLDDARRTMSSVEFDDDLYARTRDFILDAVSENQRLNAVLAHRTAQLDRLTLAKRGS